MSQTLRDQLLGLGFKPAPKPDPKPAGKRHPGGPRHDAQGKEARHKDGPGPRGNGKPGQKPGNRPAGQRPPRRSSEEIDLAKAYAIRAQKEKEERIAAEKARQEAARLRREARAKLATFLEGKALNAQDAEIARHFEYGGKIKRIYVTAEQLRALNAGELGVVQDNGRYVLVTAEVLAEVEKIFEPAVALKVDPNAPAGDDPYADPQYQIPDDLVW